MSPLAFGTTGEDYSEGQQVKVEAERTSMGVAESLVPPRAPIKPKEPEEAA